jgi:hypothetical protein
MKQDNPEYSFLRQEVERKWGRRLATSADFAALAEAMDESISVSTLKRFWGYVGDNPAPRNSTLDSLSRYSGYLNFKAFRDHLMDSGKLPSSYFQAEVVEASSLTKGERIVIGWRPDREVLLSYEGDSIFRVLESKNSSLQKDDRFEASTIMKGYPLALSGIFRNGLKTDPYVAGLDGGIAFINKR